MSRVKCDTFSCMQAVGHRSSKFASPCLMCVLAVAGTEGRTRVACAVEVFVCVGMCDCAVHAGCGKPAFFNCCKPMFDVCAPVVGESEVSRGVAGAM